jgi:hypothetical protein
VTQIPVRAGLVAAVGDHFKAYALIAPALTQLAVGATSRRKRQGFDCRFRLLRFAHPRQIRNLAKP